MKKKLAVAILAGLFIMAALTACSASSANKVIGVCMPMKSVDRWLLDGDNIRKQLDAKGYKVMLEYAENDPEKQIAQIEKMIDSKCKAIIIAASDCYGLDDVLQKAAKSKINIIAYDRLIMDTEYVDYYCTFDNYQVGVEQGKYIEDALALNKGNGPISMELFSGALDDSTTQEYYNGQMSVLKTYIDSGNIIIKSGQTDIDSTGIANWSTENAYTRMKELLNKYYSGQTRLDAVLSTNDSMALGIIEALKQSGYGNADKPLPVITGQDCDKGSVIAIINGEQSMSLFIDTRALSNKVVELVDDILMNKQPVINHTERYHNGVKAVPTLICNPIYVDKNNYMEVLVRSGYYSEDDLK